MAIVGKWSLNWNTNDSSWSNHMNLWTWTSQINKWLNWAYEFNLNWIKTTANDLFLWATSVTMYATIQTTDTWNNKFVLSDWNYIVVWLNISVNDWKISCFTDWNSWTFAKSTNAINDWKRHRICLNASSSVVSCYVDWVLNNSVSNTLNTWTHNRWSSIWNEYILNSANWINSLIDEVVFVKNWNTPVAQIKNDYAYLNGFF